MTGSCCYYACNNNFTNDLNIATYINITAGPIWGLTPMNYLKNCELSCPSTQDETERGSIICNANINRIQVESVYFKGYGALKCDAIIFDPNNRCCTSNCNCQQRCGEGCKCPLGAVQPGCPKSFKLGIPPGVESFMISVVCYRNFRYGNFYTSQTKNSLAELNCNSNYRELYRFSWWVDISRSGIVLPVFALGPYRNFDIGMERCVKKVSDSIDSGVADESDITIGEEDDTSSLNLTDSLVACRSSNSSCCPVNANIRDGICLQPFYVGVSGSDRFISSNLDDNISNFAAGSGGNVSDSQVPNNLTNLTSADAPLINNFTIQNGQMGPTLCASFCLSNKDKRENLDGDLTQLFNNCNGCLTLFVPCPRGD